MRIVGIWVCQKKNSLLPGLLEVIVCFLAVAITIYLEAGPPPRRTTTSQD